MDCAAAMLQISARCPHTPPSPSGGAVHISDPRHSQCGIYAGAKPLGAVGSWNPCCSCLFSSLPDALISSEIFAFLDRKELVTAAAVCSRWNFLAEAPPLWRNVSQRVGSGVGLARLLSRERAAHTQALACRHLRVETEADAAALAHLHLPHLVELDLSGSKGAQGSVVSSFVSRHAGLRSINLDGVTSLDDADLTLILTACTSLKHLSLANCTLLTDDGLGELGRRHKGLVSLNLNGCVGVSAIGVCAALARFTAHSSSSSSSSRDDNNVAAVAMTRRRRGSSAAELKSIRPSSSSWSRAASPAAAAVPTSRLRSLQLRGVASINDELLHAIGAAAPLLHTLDIGTNNPFGGRHSGLTDAGLLAVASACRGLVALHLQGRSGFSDDGLAAALGCLPALGEADLRGCKGVGASTVAALCAPPLASSLRSLRMFGCVGIDDPLLERLASALRGLQELDLFGCRSLSAAVVSSAAWKLSSGGGGGGGNRGAPSPAVDDVTQLTSSGGGPPPPTRRSASLQRLWVGGIPAVLAALQRQQQQQQQLLPAVLQGATSCDEAALHSPPALFPVSVQVFAC